MRKTFLMLLAAFLLASVGVFADEATIIDFTMLDPDCVNDENGNPTQNKHTVMDYAVTAGATFTDEQKALMKTSLALTQWEVMLNSSARSVKGSSLSFVKPAPVSGNSTQPFAGKNVMGVRVVFPEWNANACAFIKPPFEIPAYEPLAEADDTGNRAEQTDEEKAGGKTLFEDGYGVVKNVGTVKKIAVATMGMNFPEGLYVLLKDVDDIERRYFMGYLEFDGWKNLEWNNPNYIKDIRNREIRVYPIYPRGLPYVKFVGFQITRDANDIGGDYIGYFKDVRIIYDKALIQTERDIADEDLWGIIGTQEKAKQAAQMSRFGDKQVNRYLEQQKFATEDDFSENLSPSAGGGNGGEGGGQQGGGENANAGAAEPAAE